VQTGGNECALHKCLVYCGVDTFYICAPGGYFCTDDLAAQQAEALYKDVDSGCVACCGYDDCVNPNTMGGAECASDVLEDLNGVGQYLMSP
jgi:hypothetical protein